MDKETIIKGCENWVNNHKDENLLLTYSSVVELLAVLKEQEIAYQGTEELLRQKMILFEDAIKRLKKQEAIEPKKDWFLNNLNILEEHWFCGKCDEELVGEGKYCANCGRAVKWT